MPPKVTRKIFITKSLVFMRFSSISINLLEFFRIILFVFDLKYLSQNSINFNMLGVFWNSQYEQISKPGSAFRAKFEGDIYGFTVLATTVCISGRVDDQEPVPSPLIAWKDLTLHCNMVIMFACFCPCVFWWVTCFTMPKMWYLW